MSGKQAAAPSPAERGFGLLEVLIAFAGVAFLALLLVALVRQTTRAAAHQAQYRAAYLALEDLGEAWTAQANSALAVFIPSTDVGGADNGDGHEFDFYARDGLHHGRFWAYRFSGGQLQRYTYAARGRAGGAPGGVAAAGPPAAGITAFEARYLPASSLAGAPWLHGYRPIDRFVNLGYPEVEGGNRIVVVRVADAAIGFDRTVHLLAGTMPTGFSAVAGTFAPAPPAATLPAGPLPATPQPAQTAGAGTPPTNAPLASPTPAPPPDATATPGATGATNPPATTAPAPSASPAPQIYFSNSTKTDSLPCIGRVCAVAQTITTIFQYATSPLGPWSPCGYERDEIQADGGGTNTIIVNNCPPGNPFPSP